MVPCNASGYQAQLLPQFTSCGHHNCCTGVCPDTYIRRQCTSTAPRRAKTHSAHNLRMLSSTFGEASSCVGFGRLRVVVMLCVAANLNAQRQIMPRMSSRLGASISGSSHAHAAYIVSGNYNYIVLRLGLAGLGLRVPPSHTHTHNLKNNC